MLAWCIRDMTGDVRSSEHAEIVQPSASIGKVLLLTAVAELLSIGQLDTGQRLARPEMVRDSGLWQQFNALELTVGDACVLVGAVSDNLATNALLDLIGLGSVQDVTERIGIADIALHDRIRDERGPQDPPFPSSGSCLGWSQFMYRLANSEIIDARVSERVRTWLGFSIDHSLVLAPFERDPLVPNDASLTFVNKTGADSDLRADIGFVECAGECWSYAAISSHEVNMVSGLREVGKLLRGYVERRSRISDS